MQTSRTEITGDMFLRLSTYDDAPPVQQMIAIDAAMRWYFDDFYWLTVRRILELKRGSK